MCSKIIAVLSVVTILSLMCGTVQSAGMFPPTLEATPDSKAFPETEVVDNTLLSDPSRFITSYTYKHVMYRSVGKDVACWRCSSPCSSYYCCNDGWPQCCVYMGLCGCCRV